jgi:predicted phosphodiesterase
MCHCRWLTIAMLIAGLVIAAELGTRLLADRRIRLRGLVSVDPPAAPVVVRLEHHTLALTGAVVRAVQPRHLILRAWAPTPTVSVVEPGDAEQIALEVENLPPRVELQAAGPAEEERRGLTRLLRFAPQTTRRLGFADRTRDLTFAVLGDTGDSRTFAAALQLAARQGADFLLHAGDLVYRDEQIPHIEALLASSPLPIYTVRGNHDYRNDRRLHLMRRLAPPSYAFQLGGATFVVLDNATDYLPTFWKRSAQYRWLIPTLGLAREGPLFVAMHKPPFDPRTGQRHRGAMQDTGFARALMRDFAMAGVDAVLTGHIHESHIWARHGVPYVVSGQGATLPEEENHMAWVVVHGRNVTITQIPIWKAVGAQRPDGEDAGSPGQRADGQADHPWGRGMANGA